MGTNKIMISMPLTRYLNLFAKNYGEMFLTKTLGGQVWISNDAPGDIEGEDTYYHSFVTKSEEYLDKNYIEFNDSDFFMRIPKEISKHIELKPGESKSLNQVVKEIRAKEKG